jgi:hypothetical protein
VAEKGDNFLAVVDCLSQLAINNIPKAAQLPQKMFQQL